ncbi:MAG TPA: methyltransferase domain-containing protein [Candidatus Sulfotelmatobacter sp.]|nr:methyltransferase domain-containing protein [Candidatus Sulfotelmatobacter sp.]
MEPHAFIAEVYRRMALRHAAEHHRPNWEEMQKNALVLQSAEQYAPHLPADKDARILEIGFGDGWFLAACLKLGYTNLSGADFNIQHKGNVRDWAPGCITLHLIEDNIGDFLADKAESYDFIHISHVIEHIPKYSLFWIVDAIYRALKPAGRMLLRTPNMEGPCANSSLYVTLSHEYGFAGSNLMSLLDISGFDDIRFLTFRDRTPTLKQRLGNGLRWPFLKASKFRSRLFGVNYGGQFGSELIVIAKRSTWPPYFNERYR